MANTNTPRPPLPFGSVAQYPKSQVGVGIGVDDLASIKQVESLVGKRVERKLNLRGERGPRSTDEARKNLTRARTPFVLTCQSWIDDGRYIIAAVNPSEIGWSMPLRASSQKTHLGEIQHVWRDRRRGTFFDEPTLTIGFQSGNIMPIRNPYEAGPKRNIETDRLVVANNAYDAYIQPPQRINDTTETSPKVPDGLGNFYDFLALVDEQRILDSGETNFVYIMYNSRIFPNITLAGLFTPTGATWTDSSTDPNQVNSWSATFTVYDSYPKLNDPSGLAKVFEDSGFGRI